MYMYIPNTYIENIVYNRYNCLQNIVCNIANYCDDQTYTDDMYIITRVAAMQV